MDRPIERYCGIGLFFDIRYDETFCYDTLSLMRKTLFYSTVLAGLSVASCSMILNNLPGVYTVDVQQGNIVDQAMIDQLRPGMSKRQVLFIMGSPMLKDTFHDDRWEYLYSNQPGGEPRQQKRISLYFKDDNIVGLQGDFKPSKLPVLKPSTDVTVDVPKRNLDESLWGTISAWFNADTTEVKSGAEPEAAATEKIKTDDGGKSDDGKSFWDSFTGWFGGDDVPPPGNQPSEGQKENAPSTSPNLEDGAQ